MSAFTFHTVLNGSYLTITELVAEQKIDFSPRECLQLSVSFAFS